MSENEINKGKIYVAYITTLGIPELTYALAYVVDEASANGVKRVAKHTSSSIGWAKQDIRRVYNLEKYKELFPQGYEMIDLDEIMIHCRVGFDLCVALAINEVRKAAGLKDQTPNLEEKKEMSEQETHAAVVKLARGELKEHERINCWFRPEFVRALIDGLDAAHKRETDVLKQRCAELNAEVAAKDEVIKRLNDAISEEQRRKMATAENSSAVGDAAKLREALVEIREAMIRDSGTGPCTEFHTKVDTITQAALDAPPRNCDKYSHDEALQVWASEKGNEHNGCFDEWLYEIAKDGGVK